MRCDDCGCDLVEGEGVPETRSVQSGAPSRFRGNTSTESILVCRPCAKKRTNVLGFVLRMLGPFLLAIALLALLNRWIGP